ncbi:MAG: DUF1579 domain-containing protein [Phycisphaerales bacterium]|nr:DUF1579 domain-containing protein [Phycisphaerales bacterium]
MTMRVGSGVSVLVIAAAVSAMAWAEPPGGTSTPATKAAQPSATPDNAARKENPMDVLKSWAGEWDAEITFWFRPDAAPVTTKARLSAELVLDGKFLQQKMEGGDLGPGTAKWSSMSLIGYNPFSKEFECTRYSSTIPAMMPMRGAANGDEAKRLELSGAYPFMGGKATARDVIITEGPDVQRIESYMSFGGSPEFKGAEIVLKRRK